MSGIVDEFYNATFFIPYHHLLLHGLVLYQTKYIYDLRNN